MLVITTVDATLEAFLLPFAHALRNDGWTVDAAAHNASHNGCVRQAFRQFYDVEWGRRPLSVGSAQAVRSIRRLVTAGAYDIVWVHTPVASFVTRYALSTMPTRPVVIYTAHGFHFYPGQSAVPYAAYHALERAAARWTDYIVTMNDADTQAARAFGTIPQNRVRHIPGIGVDVGRYVPDVTARLQLRSAYGVTQEDVVFAMIAEFTPNKRHQLVLRALERTSSPRLQVLFVGDGPLKRETEALCESLGLSRQVHFLGYRNDIPAVLSSADVFLIASAREGLVRSGLEAMAIGMPLTGTPTRGFVDLVGADVAGWVAESHSPADLAEAMKAAAANPVEMRRRGLAGRRIALSVYALPNVIASYQRIFNEALDARAQRQ